MYSKLLIFALGFAGAIAGSITFQTVMVMAEADNSPSTDNLGRYIPYDGYLELDGESVSADDMAMRFTIYDDGDNALWNEELTVNIYNGKFAVLLGQTSDITSTVFDAEDIFIGVEVFSDNQWIALSGRQLITPVPFALWAGQGSQFVVAGSLKINGSDLQLGLDDGRSTGDSTYQRALVHGNSDTLYVNYDGDFEGGTVIGSGLTVSGSVSSGAITSSGALSSGAITSSGAISATGSITSDSYIQSDTNFFAGGTSGGGVPSWFDEEYTHGIKVHSGSDNAFFGLRNRSSGNSNSYDTVIYFGDDTDDDLIFSSQDGGDVATMNSDGDFTVSTINDKSLSGTGLTCTSVSERGSSSDDAWTEVDCASGYTMVGCTCYSAWKNCDGAYIDDNTCRVRAGGGGDYLQAQGRCCKVH